MAFSSPQSQSRIAAMLRQNSLAPFLYQTKPLMHPSGISRSVSISAGNLSKRRRLGQKISARSRSQMPGTVRSRSDSRGCKISSQGNDRETEIPFEGTTASADLAERVRGSTMTPRELGKFEELMRKEIASDKKKKTSKEGTMPQRNPTDVEFPAPLRDLAEEFMGLRTNMDGSEDQTSIDTATLDEHDKHFREVKDQMDRSTSDVSLWNILQEDVLSRVVTLQKQLTAGKTSRQREIQELTRLIRNVPHLLVHFMQLVQTKFQGSPYGTVLLPSLKKLGPSAFALIASTDLYNEHMRILYRQHSDLDAIAESLGEMDQEVYEFNNGTLDLLGAILNHAYASMRGRNGPGQQALWLTDRKTRAVAKIERWSQTVELRIQAGVLRRARQSPGDDRALE